MRKLKEVGEKGKRSSCFTSTQVIVVRTGVHNHD